jgi:hypothetical protein
VNTNTSASSRARQAFHISSEQQHMSVRFGRQLGTPHQTQHELLLLSSRPLVAPARSIQPASPPANGRPGQPLARRRPRRAGRVARSFSAQRNRTARRLHGRISVPIRERRPEKKKPRRRPSGHGVFTNTSHVRHCRSSPRIPHRCEFGRAENGAGMRSDIAAACGRK